MLQKIYMQCVLAKCIFCMHVQMTELNTDKMYRPQKSFQQAKCCQLTGHVFDMLDLDKILVHNLIQYPN